MLNQEMRTVTMNRSDMLRVAQALTHVVLEFRDEVRTATTEDRRRSAKCVSGYVGAHPQRVRPSDG